MSLQSRTKRQVFAPGDIIVKQGDQGDYAYMLEDGQIEIFLTRTDGEEQILGKRGPGALIGEMAIIDAKPRTASVRAVTPCTLLAISHDDFSRRMSMADPVIRLIMHVILARYRSILYGGDGTGAGTEAAEAEKAESVNDRAFETIRMTHEFKEAILGYHLRLHYQPIINIKTKQVVGFEGLMRWIHPEKGMISPGIFIPLAEDSGLIVHATRWAVREALTLLDRLSAEHSLAKDCFMSLNFTGLDLAEEDFEETLATELKNSNIAPSRLKLEITERMLIDDPEGTIATLENCRKSGLKVALDDFGTGYSSLSYLHKFPIDTMKIDRSFVIDMVDNPVSLTLVKTIVALARGLNMNIVAEGVETQAESDLLSELDVEMIQGYLYARPMAELDLIPWLQERS